MPGGPMRTNFRPSTASVGGVLSFSKAPEHDVRKERPKRPPRSARHVHMLDAHRMIKLAIAKHSPDRILPAVTAQNEPHLRCIRASDCFDGALIRTKELGLIDEQPLHGRLGQVGLPVA